MKSLLRWSAASLAAALLVSAAHNANAQVFLGNSSANWSDGGNWPAVFPPTPPRLFLLAHLLATDVYDKQQRLACKHQHCGISLQQPGSERQRDDPQQLHLEWQQDHSGW